MADSLCFLECLIAALRIKMLPTKYANIANRGQRESESIHCGPREASHSTKTKYGINTMVKIALSLTLDFMLITPDGFRHLSDNITSYRFIGSASLLFTGGLGCGLVAGGLGCGLGAGGCGLGAGGCVGAGGGGAGTGVFFSFSLSTIALSAVNIKSSTVGKRFPPFGTPFSRLPIEEQVSVD